MMRYWQIDIALMMLCATTLRLFNDALMHIYIINEMILVLYLDLQLSQYSRTLVILI